MKSLQLSAVLRRLGAAVVLMGLQTGCKTSTAVTRPVELLDHAGSPSMVSHTFVSYQDAFRAFRQAEFPTGKWVVDGAVLRSVEGKGIDLITRSEYHDFEFSLDWKVTKGANSGIMYGVSEDTSETYWSGPEYQINDDPNHDDGKVPITSAGALYDLLPPNASKRLKPTGEWNETRIVSRGGHIEHWLNGTKILEYDWNSPVMRGLISKTKFADQAHFMKELNGHIALQHHGAEVWFRNIRIVRL